MRSAVLAVLLAVLPATLAVVLPRQAVSPPTCVLTCIGSSVSATPCAPSDTACLCGNPLFITAVAKCLAAGCSPADQAAGVKFGENYCQSIGLPVVIPIAIAAQASSLAAGGSGAPASAAPATTAAPAAATTAAVAAPAPAATTAAPVAAPAASSAAASAAPVAPKAASASSLAASALALTAVLGTVTLLL